MNDNVLLSICIPSYNRPIELARLLNSIDIQKRQKIEIVICEDHAPARHEVGEKVNYFIEENKYNVRYIENEVNMGYDKNLRECIKNASGKWIIYMGDDDLFVPGTMDAYLEFLEQHDELGYVLRAYRALHEDGTVEQFKYYEETCYFPAGFETYMKLFRKSVFISGFTFRREYALENMTERFDGTLLYQLYILAEICMKYPAAYYGIPITQSIDGGTPYFGNSESEKRLYTPGTITVDNSINFMKNFFVITNYMDEKYNISSTDYVKRDISKYAYPVLSIQRKNGRRSFVNYHYRLRALGIAVTPYYYIYYFALYLFGEKFCDKIIRNIKKLMGRTPKL